jgi:hypothetical protein
MKISLTGPLMGPANSVYLEELQSEPFHLGDEITVPADASPTTLEQVAALVEAELAIPVPTASPAQEEKED